MTNEGYLSPETIKTQSETPEEYHDTCHRFKMENNRYYTDNNYYRGILLPLKTSRPNDEYGEGILTDIHEYYTAQGDKFNLLRYYEKIGDQENSYKMAEQIEQNGTLIEKAHSAEQIWKNFKDSAYKQKAIDAYTELARGYEESGDNLMAAIHNDLLFKITKDEEYRKKAIEFHRQFATERADKGDSWWQAISLREVGKLSKGTGNQNEAIDVGVKHADQEIKRAAAVGDFKNAGLWARDIFKLAGTPESLSKAKKIFLEQVEKSKQDFAVSGKSSDLRTIGKSYWEMWKVTNEEEHRQKAMECYKKLLEIAKMENNEEQKKECYRVLLYITQ